MIIIDQLSQLIEYDSRIRKLQLDAKNKNLVSYFSERSDARQSYEQQLLQLRDDIASSDINSEYKEKFLATINEYFGNLRHNQAANSPSSDVVLSFIAGVFVGAIAKYGFDKTVDSFEEKFVEHFKTSFYNKLSSMQKGVSDEHKQGQRI